MPDIIDLRVERTKRDLEEENEHILRSALLAWARAMATEFGQQSVVNALLDVTEELTGDIAS